MSADAAPIQFTSPRCTASHTRGYHHGQTCLNCGYVGVGHHPDEEIDAAISAENATNQAWNVTHGLPVGPRQP